jgi:2-hydroxy-3-oxopropionate reductase
MSTKIGFIGLGTMGKVMSRRLMAAGYSLTVWNRTEASAQELIAEGATWANSPKEVAATSDVVFTMTSDAAASAEVICGLNGVLEGAHEGLVVIDSASIAPEASQANAAQAEEKGVALLDAPVSGGPKVAEKGALGIMVGGSEEGFKKAEPILNELGKMVLYCGASGNGTTLKLIANLVMGVAIQASAEALVLAAKVGMDPQVVIDITSLPGTGPQTGAMATRGPRMVKHNFFPPHFSTNNMDKDLTGAIRLAEKHGVSLPTASAARETLRAVKSQGNGHIDSSAVVTVLEAMADTSVCNE